MQRSPSRLGNDAGLAAELTFGREPANQFVLGVCAAMRGRSAVCSSCFIFEGNPRVWQRGLFLSLGFQPILGLIASVKIVSLSAFKNLAGMDFVKLRLGLRLGFAPKAARFYPM